MTGTSADSPAAPPPSSPSSAIPAAFPAGLRRRKRAAAVALLDGQDAATRQHFSGYFVEYALLGDMPRSLASVQHHAKRPPASWMQYLWWPELAAVRAMPAFGAAMRDLGAAALWDQRGAPELCARGTAGEWLGR